MIHKLAKCRAWPLVKSSFAPTLIPQKFHGIDIIGTKNADNKKTLWPEIGRPCSHGFKSISFYTIGKHGPSGPRNGNVRILSSKLPLLTLNMMVRQFCRQNVALSSSFQSPHAERLVANDYLRVTLTPTMPPKQELQVQQRPTTPCWSNSHKW